MRSVLNIVQGVLYLLVFGFVLGATWGACVIGSRLIQQLVR